MEGLGSFYAVVLHIPQLRKGLMTEYERPRWYQQTSTAGIHSIRLRLRLANLHSVRLCLSSRAIGEQFVHATFVEVGYVRPCAVKSALEFVSFAQKLVPLGEKVLVLLAETVPIVFDPRAVRLSQLSQHVADE